jgi:integrase/recombinase XerD
LNIIDNQRVLFFNRQIKNFFYRFFPLIPGGFDTKMTRGEYQKLMNTPCKNYEVQKAFVFSLYTGLRWTDVKSLDWSSIRDDAKTFKICQKKTGAPLERPLHEIAREIIGERKEGLVFYLPSADGANKLLQEWATDAGLEKHISWHCARHSFSVLLQDEGTDTATVAGMLGHTSTKFVHRVYQRYRHLNAVEAIQTLPIFRKMRVV